MPGAGGEGEGGGAARPGGEGGALPPSVRYIRMFNGFFRDAAMTSTYKVALLRALADVGGYGGDCLAGGHWIGTLDGSGSGGGGGRMVMDLNFAAARFAKFYWDMEVGFGFLHIAPGSGIRRRPRRLLMSRLVAAEARRREDAAAAADPSCAVPSLDELASPAFDGLRKRTVAVIQRDVLDAVSRDMPGLYEVMPGRRHVSFGADLVCFMREYGPAVEGAQPQARRPDRVPQPERGPRGHKDRRGPAGRQGGRSAAARRRRGSPAGPRRRAALTYARLSAPLGRPRPAPAQPGAGGGRGRGRPRAGVENEKGWVIRLPATAWLQT